MKAKGAVALVTGAAKGLGRSFCYKLLEHGAASVKILDICEDDGIALQKELEAKYGSKRATFRPCDVTNKEDLEKAFTETYDENGKLNIVCNNAGIGDEKDWQRTIDVNLGSVIQGTFLGLKLMKDGVIVNTSSMGEYCSVDYVRFEEGRLISSLVKALQEDLDRGEWGLLPMSISPVYCATKHGVVGFSRSMAKAAASQGVRVNCICPAFADTPLLASVMSSPEIKALIEQVGVVSPQLVAEGLMTLIEDDERNGEVLTVTLQRGIEFQRFFGQGI